MQDEDLAFLGHGERKFPSAGLLASSEGRGWRAVGAEIRRHPAGEIPDILPDQLEVTLALSGDGSATVSRRGDGALQETAVAPNVAWLCPPGIYEESIRISSELSSILHIYLPPERFAELAAPGLSRRLDAHSLRYAAGLDDPVLTGVGIAIDAELRNESAGGALLVDYLSLALAIHLCGTYAGLGPITIEQATGALDARRLQRVKDFIETNIALPFGVEDLAEVACLSAFHFARAFKAATGAPPHRYVAARRLAHAKVMLAVPATPITDIAYRCGFSSVSTFSRAFRRAVGVSPADFRGAH